MKIERESPAVKAPKDGTAKGFSHAHEKSTAPGKLPEEGDLPMAIATKTAKTASWRPTSPYCTPLVAVTPR
ncbi:hypothetical protein GCM10020000_46630 [Streptomyces olivoverticillatus]